jgi:hypothetical protein
VVSIDKQDPAGSPAAPTSAAPGPQPDAEASRAAADTALLEAFGGVWGMVDTTVPGLVFVIAYTIDRDLKLAGALALSLSVLLGLARLARRQTLKHAFSGVFGVAFGYFFAMLSGNAKNFYLPGMLYTLGLAVAYVVSAVAGFPLIGLLLGPVLKENLSWRDRNPGRRVAYSKSTWAWGIILLAKSAILFPLYWWGSTAQLGWVKVALGIPPFLLAVYLTWIFLAKAPPPIDVIAELEAAEAAERDADSDEAGEAAGTGVSGGAGGPGGATVVGSAASPSPDTAGRP